MRGSNTRSIEAGERARGRTEGGEEVFLVIVCGTDAVDEMVSNVSRAQRASSGLSCGQASAASTSPEVSRHAPDQTIRHSKQNSCEQVGTTVRSTIGCRQMVHCSSSTSSSASSSFSASLPDIDDDDDDARLREMSEHVKAYITQSPNSRWVHWM